MSTDELLEAQRGRLERREKRIAELEDTVAERLREVDERESERIAREARLEADAEVREARSTAARRSWPTWKSA
jgi:hypothetical protein